MEAASIGVILSGKEVANVILRVIGEARRHLYVVSPYLDICRWKEAKDVIETAKGQNSKPSITFIVCREDQGSRTRESIEWLKEKGIKVVEVGKLHAKIYINENAVLSSSMNLTKSSLDNHEMAYQVMDTIGQNRLRQQVKNLMTANPDEMTLCARCGSLNRPRNRRGGQTPAGDLPLCYACYLEWKKINNLP